ncbi:lipoprotein [Pantoea sp. 1.19]|uniref:lipoprotein n=1 Tax=Pantoea sp. 1.19 TaxID=1925589 RepID=UPI000948C17E|nr:lipoprotein [Pantoea sp. 1.19]
MKSRALAALLPLTLLLSACTTVQPVYKDNGPRIGSCTEGGPDSVAQAFYDLRLQQPQTGLPDSVTLARYRPLLSDKLYTHLQKARSEPGTAAALAQRDLFSSQPARGARASVADASTIPNRDARNIPLRVDLSRDNVVWQDEVLMIHEGNCWVVDDIRYLSDGPQTRTGTLIQTLEK